MSIILKGLNVNNRPAQRDGQYAKPSLNPERVEYQLIVNHIFIQLRHLTPSELENAFSSFP